MHLQPLNNLVDSFFPQECIDLENCSASSLHKHVHHECSQCTARKSHIFHHKGVLTLLPAKVVF